MRVTLERRASRPEPGVPERPRRRPVDGSGEVGDAELEADAELTADAELETDAELTADADADADADASSELVVEREHAARDASANSAKRRTDIDGALTA